MQKEFEYIQEWLKGIGIDIGCGTNRISPSILAIDQQPDKRYAHADIAHDCKDLEIQETELAGHIYTFKDETLDFIFSSHCLEDFDDIPTVFKNWWKKLKKGGIMILLLPDMQGGRYPKVGDPLGNPSHKTDVGKEFMNNMLNTLKESGHIDYEMLQEDTFPHNETCTIDFVIKKEK